MSAAVGDCVDVDCVGLVEQIVGVYVDWSAGLLSTRDLNCGLGLSVLGLLYYSVSLIALCLFLSYPWTMHLNVAGLFAFETQS